MKKYTADDIKVLKADPSLWDDVDISLGGFAKNLNDAACLARDFTRNYVNDLLPDNMKYLVCLGCSYDKNPLQEDEETFPEDYDNSERELSSQDELVNLLWRNGKVPEWINVQVLNADESYTYIQLICCGRFSSRKMSIYHPHEGRAPFHVLGPDLPVNYQVGEKFDLHWRKNA